MYSVVSILCCNLRMDDILEEWFQCGADAIANNAEIVLIAILGFCGSALLGCLFVCCSKCHQRKAQEAGLVEGVHLCDEVVSKIGFDCEQGSLSRGRHGRVLGQSVHKEEEAVRFPSLPRLSMLARQFQVVEDHRLAIAVQTEDIMCAEVAIQVEFAGAEPLIPLRLSTGTDAPCSVRRESAVQTTATFFGMENGLVQMGEPVLLHIYDVGNENMQWVNGILINAGTGAFHAGVEVFGFEWSFGHSTNQASGVNTCAPKKNSLHRYRESLDMGVTPLSESEVTELLRDYSQKWQADMYDLLTCNCCHFCDALCQRLAVGPVPQRIMNLAGAGARLRSGVDSAMTVVQNAMGVVAANTDGIGVKISCDIEKVARDIELWAS